MNYMKGIGKSIAPYLVAALPFVATPAHAEEKSTPNLDTIVAEMLPQSTTGEILLAGVIPGKTTIDGKTYDNQVLVDHWKKKGMTEEQIAKSKYGSIIQLDAQPGYVGLRYSANSFGEFFNGIIMPFTLWRTNPQTKKKEILPAYTHAIREGGLLSPLNPWAWMNNAPLTGGVLVTDLGLAFGTMKLLEKPAESNKENPANPPGTDPDGNDPNQPNI